ncbi:MAG TPA: NAD(P)-dependent oxidoreductase [Ktedonobacteraceae bacterium]|jgi:3-hydroxyisobutyrate dehydrogenase-like beta-hydroxyacid dehydrogenase
MTTLGFIGLGAMGGRVVRRLLAAGYEVIGYNRTREKAQWLLAAGMRWADSAHAVAQAAAITFTMVSDTHALSSVVDGPQGLLAGLGPGKIYIDMSTVSPSASRQLAGRVLATGAQMLDVPVSGSVSTLEQGRLSLMVGGPRAVLEQVRPILLAIGPKITYVGANGQAVLMKVAINLNLLVQIQGFYEGLILAEKGGIPREVALEAMLNSVIASPSLAYRTPFLLQKPDEAWFNVNMMQKDMLLALEMGRELAVPLPLVASSNESLTAARAQGLAGEDFAMVYQVLARMAGLEV